MSIESPAVAYRTARKQAFALQQIEDFNERAERWRALKAHFVDCFHALIAAADSGDPEVWYALGDAFTSGIGTERDRGKARRWFQRAAEAGHTEAMVSFGVFLQCSEDAPDLVAAVRWYRAAADKGDTGAMAQLGFAYRDGRGVSSDPVEALRWFIKAVDSGDGHSMINVGRMYSYELAQPSEALRWFLRAAEAGFTESHIALATLYDDRKSGAYDPVQAVRWYQVVVERNRGSVSRAMLALARHCRDGIGTPRDLTIAKNWLHRLLQIVPERSAVRTEAKKLLNQMEGALL